MKSIFSYFSVLTVVVLTMIASTATALSRNSILGFGEAKYEIAINPCVDEFALRDRFGEEAVRLREEALKQWPEGLCNNNRIAYQLATWNYHYTSLLAKTERPVVIANEIAKHNKTLHSCLTLECLNRHLPRMIEWVYFNIDRLPVYTDAESASRGQAPLAGAPVMHPTLALRNLPSQLTGMAAVCQETSISELDFYTVDFSVEGRPIVLATCKHSLRAPVTNHSAWLLERINGDTSSTGAGWREILVDHNVTRLYIAMNSRTTYPTLFSRRNINAGEEVSFYAYQESVQHYVRSVVLNIAFDSQGRAHGFVQSQDS